ncbi:MAG: hypothetical protein ACXVDA_17635 [Ktedonobacterales bacterium]
MMRTRRWSKFTALAIVVMGASLASILTGLSGCGASSSNSIQVLPVSQDQHYSQTVGVEASWYVGYKDLKSLKVASTAAVVGTIAAVAGATVDTKTNSPSTDFTVSIETVVHDPHGRVRGATLLVHQTGGIVNDTLYQMSDDPLFRVGEHVVLFLHEYEPGKFFVEGGPTGRFEVRSGIVSAATTSGVTLPPSISVDDFLAQVRDE